MKAFQEFIDKGLIRKEKIDFSQVVRVLAKAQRSAKSAKVLFADGDFEGSYQLAYEAMLLSGRALIFSHGFKPRAAGSHKITIGFVEKVLGKEETILVFKFDKMRKNRHYLIYGAGLSISETEAKNAISSAKEFVSEIEKLVQKKNPQKKLFQY
ncbi:MAG: hypothetical protein A2359_01155 [Candidatus Moranbacteria bacterium RIFOXYB1_FULL_43_19]|nr:MAG: hypothetical protein A2359_01155 [Candidatus Moranbacteria bacterium RIFOXYB1_FULL_43_19]OGI33020.1 MAG: hypothetical protein A2420_01580 [Candidatus Moranbacteria bacterium RIFOXYC1_FULL_44_13]OGI38433.1 MAG: hypothetical protein A2612_01635 [Candidatus Moranbacteria bacterium RIFOXYD1_FULL_44_12]